MPLEGCRLGGCVFGNQAGCVAANCGVCGYVLRAYSACWEHTYERIVLMTSGWVWYCVVGLIGLLLLFCVL